MQQEKERFQDQKPSFQQTTFLETQIAKFT